MAIALVQTKKQSGGGYVNSYTVALTSNATAGNQLILALTAGASDTISSISDNRSNTWVLDKDTTGTDRKTWIYRASNISAGATTITITFTSGQFPDSVAIVREYSGLASSPLDQTASGNSGTNYVNSHSTSASPSTTQADELVFVAVGSSGSTSPGFTAGSGYGNLDAQSGFDAFTYGAVEHKIVSATGAQTGTFSSTGFVRSQTALVTYKAASTPTTVNADRQNGTIAILAPVVAGAAIVAGSLLTGVLGIHSPTVRGSAQIAPSVISRTLTVQAPTVTVPASTSPNSLNSTFAIQAPSPSGGDQSTQPSTIGAAISIQNPTPGGAASNSPNKNTGTLSVLAPAVTGSASVSPSIQALTLNTHPLTPSGSATLTAEAISATLAVLTPSYVGVPVPANGSPIGLLLALTYEISPIHYAQVQSATLTVQAPTVRGEGQTSPSAVTGTFNLPAPTLSISAQIAPDRVNAVFAILTPTIRGGVWTATPKPTTTWDSSAKPTTSWSSPNKPTTAWTGSNKPTTTWDDSDKPTSIWTPVSKPTD